MSRRLFLDLLQTNLDLAVLYGYMQDIMCKSVMSILYFKVNISCPSFQLQPKTGNKAR